MTYQKTVVILLLVHVSLLKVPPFECWFSSTRRNHFRKQRDVGRGDLTVRLDVVHGVVQLPAAMKNEKRDRERRRAAHSSRAVDKHLVIVAPQRVHLARGVPQLAPQALPIKVANRNPQHLDSSVTIRVLQHRPVDLPVPKVFIRLRVHHRRHARHSQRLHVLRALRIRPHKQPFRHVIKLHARHEIHVLQLKPAINRHRGAEIGLSVRLSLPLGAASFRHQHVSVIKPLRSERQVHIQHPFPPFHVRLKHLHIAQRHRHRPRHEPPAQLRRIARHKHPLAFLRRVEYTQPHLVLLPPILHPHHRRRRVTTPLFTHAPPPSATTLLIILQHQPRHSDAVRRVPDFPLPRAIRARHKVLILKLHHGARHSHLHRPFILARRRATSALIPNIRHPLRALLPPRPQLRNAPAHIHKIAHRRAAIHSKPYHNLLLIRSTACCWC
mmetsp:Transcript_11964/g.26095  ORF Transcript_11964/g.26095 Transcript_11964/m.26095 type:complete len:440 (-) Transcript_11964:1291-2610(-)